MRSAHSFALSYNKKVGWKKEEAEIQQKKLRGWMKTWARYNTHTHSYRGLGTDKKKKESLDYFFFLSAGRREWGERGVRCAGSADRPIHSMWCVQSTHTYSFFCLRTHTKERDGQRSACAGPSCTLYTVLRLRMGERSIQLKRRSILLLLPWKKRKEEASLESRSSDDGLFLAGETYCR